MNHPLRIGTRGSPLALWQARYVAELLQKAAPDCLVELVQIKTMGDEVGDLPLAQLGGEGAFTKAIQQALLERRIDLAVHSLKDLPTFVVPGLVLAAVPQRGPTGDAFVSTKHRCFRDLPRKAVVATSSLRRRAQLLNRRPDLRLLDMRGNVDTRLRKLDEQDLDALVLAEAGLHRLGLERHIAEVLDPQWMFPAVGQGALGLECRQDDYPTRQCLQPLDDPATHACILAERALLHSLGGGCHVPIGATTRLVDSSLAVRGVVLSVDGQNRLDGEIFGTLDQAEELGLILAQDLLARGASRLLKPPCPP